MPFLVSVASVLHWFTGTAYTGFPGQTNSNVKTVFWRDCICIAAQCYWVLQDYYAPRWPDSLGNAWHGISLSRALWVEEGFSRWGLMLCNEGQFRGARGWCDSAVFPVPRAALTQWFVWALWPHSTNSSRWRMTLQNTRVSQLIVLALCQHSQAWCCQHI